jgi:hypothetical protein
MESLRKMVMVTTPQMGRKARYRATLQQITGGAKGSASDNPVIDNGAARRAPGQCGAAKWRYAHGANVTMPRAVAGHRMAMLSA